MPLRLDELLRLFNEKSVDLAELLFGLIHQRHGVGADFGVGLLEGQHLIQVALFLRSFCRPAPLLALILGLVLFSPAARLVLAIHDEMNHEAQDLVSRRFDRGDLARHPLKFVRDSVRQLHLDNFARLENLLLLVRNGVCGLGRLVARAGR